MLETLHISNYALIDEVDIKFFEGLNIITGETGAGKSIILGALSLLLGGRADSHTVRATDRKSVIEAVFTAGDNTALKSYCDENDIEWDDARFILRREIAPNGRSRAFINDSPVTLGRLEDVALQLVDIHSQHQNQLLSSPEFQLRIIDTIAANQSRLQIHATRYAALREAMRRLKTAKAEIQRSRDDEEFTRYQLEQLDELKLEAGELEQLERDREVLSNMTEIKGHLYDALQALNCGPRNILGLLDDLSDTCTDLENVLDAKDNIPSRLETVTIELQDITETIAGIDERLNADPLELEMLESRIDAINSMMRRHHAENVEQLITLRENLRKRLALLEDSDDTIAELERNARRALALARESASEISEARKEAALRFAEELKECAMPLGMKNLQCVIGVEPADMSATGADKVAFLFAFNKNQPLMQVGNAASGGEISRLMLSIKTIIASRMNLPSIIFDEVDTGVSGDVANRIGSMMQAIGRNIQVIAITHLPQVAAKGAHHFKVYKEDDDTATHTHITELNADERVAELAVMLSGDHTDEAALANARSLLIN